MNRRNWLLAALLAAPLAVGGAVYAKSQAKGYTCPITGEQLACENCCPLNQETADQTQPEGYVCPVTGETLPCPNCCPLNKGE